MWQDRQQLLHKIVQQYGSPLYVYDTDLIKKQISHLKGIFSDIDADIHYAMKANENLTLLKFIKSEGIGIDTVSLNEIKRALEAGFKPEQILFTPSCPDEEILHEAFKQGVHIHIAAVEYLDFVLKHYKDYPVGLRINPGNSIQGNQKIATAHHDSKFGIPLSRLDEVSSYVNKGLKVKGLHIHTGSDVNNWQDLARSFDTLLDLADSFPDLTYLDLGSGFKVAYKQSDTQIDLSAYVDYIAEKLRNYPKKLKIKFEPGKFIVSESSVFIVKVNVVKKGYNKTFAGVNSGFHHLIRPMYYDAYHEIVNISNPDAPKQTYDIVGMLCEEDTFAYNREISQIRKNDLLMIKNAGAYGFSMAMQYNLNPLPKQILIDGSDVIEI